VDFIELRRALAANERWDEELTADIMPGALQRRAFKAALPWTDEAAAGVR
jgi:hypothetical protein